MAIVRQMASVPTSSRAGEASGVGGERVADREPLPGGGPITGGGTTGNERLTAASSALLLALLAVIGVTLLRLGQLLSVHLFVGMLLIPPVLLKLGSTGYRFIRYYTANAAYRRKGPPPALLRVLAPALIASTLVVFASGVALLFVGPSSRGELLPIHKFSFIAWGALVGVHVLAHLPSIPRAFAADYGRSSLSGDVTGRSGRTLALAGALVAGIVVAIIVIPQFGPWLHAVASVQHDH
jgi:hypothetical protein